MAADPPPASPGEGRQASGVREDFTKAHESGTRCGKNTTTLDESQAFQEVFFETIAQAFSRATRHSSLLLGVVNGRPAFRSSWAKASTDFSVK